jgi:hypothetical protein
MKKFEYKDYPALYQASDTVSNDTQNTYLLLMKLNISRGLRLNNTLDAIFSIERCHSLKEAHCLYIFTYL